jgi:hypothetical protein
MGMGSGGWGRGVSASVGVLGRPFELVICDEGLHPVPIETLGKQRGRQIPEPRVTERGDDVSHDDAGVIPRTGGQRARADPAENGDSMARGERAISSSGLLDGVAGQLQHCSGQSR